MKKYRGKRAGENILRTYDLLLKEWGTATEEMNIRTRYGMTHIITAGKKDAAPVVLFHGVGDDSALMWIYNAKELAKHYHIYAVDTIGGPGKSEPDENYNKDFDDVLWIDDIFSALKLDKASIAGVSHGGYMVQLYTLRRPERVRKAVAISSGVASGDKNGSPMKTMMKIFLPEALFPTKKNIEKLLKKLSGKQVAAFTENEKIMEHYGWLLKGFNNMAMGYHKVNVFTDEEIDKIRDRIVYLIGEEDPFAKLGGKEALVKYKMNTTFYPDAGHGLNHELAGEINKKLIDIL